MQPFYSSHAALTSLTTNSGKILLIFISKLYQSLFCQFDFNHYPYHYEYNQYPPQKVIKYPTRLSQHLINPSSSEDTLIFHICMEGNNTLEKSIHQYIEAVRCQKMTLQ